MSLNWNITYIIQYLGKNFQHIKLTAYLIKNIPSVTWKSSQSDLGFIK